MEVLYLRIWSPQFFKSFPVSCTSHVASNYTEWRLIVYSTFVNERLKHHKTFIPRSARVGQRYESINKTIVRHRSLRCVRTHLTEGLLLAIEGLTRSLCPSNPRSSLSRPRKRIKRRLSGSRLLPVPSSPFPSPRFRNHPIPNINRNPSRKNRST